MTSGIWDIELFGGLRLVQADRAISRFRTQKTASLLAFLALHIDRPHPREVLVNLLWPDEPIEAGRNGLRVALNSLRKQLEPLGTPYGAVLFADRNQVQLNAAACSTDVGRFASLLRSDRDGEPGRAVEALVEAADLYRGEMLPALYDDWIILERERLSQMYLSCLATLSRSFMEAKDYNRAADYANRTVQADPYCEEAYQILITAHASNGNSLAARQWFDRFAELIETDLGSTPSAQTVALSDRYKLGERKGASAALPASPQRAAAPGATVPKDTTRAAVRSATPANPHAKLEAGRSAGADRINHFGRLPYSFTSFLGREDEIALLCRLLSRHAVDGSRTLTLTGPGGSGKTRLAVEAARLLAPEYEGAVAFVPLSEEHDASRIAEAVARSLGLPRSAAAQYWDAVIDRLNRAPAALLILDGFEHLAADGAGVVLALRQASPTTRVLATSRRRLEIPGDRDVSISPLPIPLKTDTAESVQSSPSVMLFVNRAQTAASDFAVTSRNTEDLAAVCRALEGIPLAIELAAARARSMGLREMREQLTEPTAAANRFHLLTSRRADKPDRQRSLWAAIAWSVELLPPPLRRFFAHLSVFHGGWTIAAAVAVCDDPYTREHLTQLRAHSLVQYDGEAFPEPRFRLLDSLREFAEELLLGADSDALALRHIDFFAGLADESRQRLRGSDQTAWLKRLDAENQNLRAAMRWSLSHLDRAADSGLRLAGSLAQYWQLHGPLRESAALTADLIDRTESLGVTPNRAAAHNTAAGLCLRLGDYDAARRYLDTGLAAYRQLNDDSGVGRMIMNRGYLHWIEGSLQASYDDRRESLGIFLRIGDRWQAAAAYLNLGSVQRDLGDHGAAVESFEASLAISREIADPRGAGSAILNLANVAYSAGDLLRARAWYEESLAITREQENPLGTALALSNIGALLLNSRELDAAETYFSEALTLGREMGDDALSGAFLIELGRIATARGDLAQAHERLAESISHSLSHVKLCVALEAFAQLCVCRNALSEAAYFYGAADSLRESGSSPIQPHDLAAHEEELARLRARFGSGKFEENWGRGQCATKADAIDSARGLPKVKSTK